MSLDDAKIGSEVAHDPISPLHGSDTISFTTLWYLHEHKKLI